MLIEIAGGPDMEFSIPSPASFMPWLSVTPQSGLGINKPSRDTDLYEGQLGASSVIDDATNSAAICVGEKVSSFRTLLKMAKHKPYLLTGPPFNSYMNIIPFGVESCLAAATPSLPANAPDLYDIMAAIYVYSRGGVRFHVTPNIDPSTTWLTPISWLNCPQNFSSINANALLSFSGVDPTYGTSPVGRLNTLAFHNVQTNRAFEVQVPQYSRYHSRVNAAHLIAPTVFYDNSRGSLATKVRLTTHFPGNIPTFTSIYRSGADDLNFGLFVSIPEFCMGFGASYKVPP